MIQLGQKVRDRVHGFEGIATGVVDYLTGCRQYLVVPPVDKDGKIRDAHWLDEARLEIVDPNPIVLTQQRQRPALAPAGNDMAPPVR